jgi:excisionase family DNA binding protein
VHKRKQTQPTVKEIRPLLLTVPQAADLLGVGKDMVYDFIHCGSLPVVDLSKPGARQKLRISLSALESWVEQQERLQNPLHDLLMSAQPDERIQKRLRKTREGGAHPGGITTPPTSRQRHSRPS